jgi:hypothetical protein
MTTAKLTAMRRRMTIHSRERSSRLALSKGCPKKKAKTGACFSSLSSLYHFSSLAFSGRARVQSPASPRAVRQSKDLKRCKF